MSKNIPFDEDVLTLIMGVEPSEPGQHGRTMAPKPDKDAVGVVCQIRDLCEEFLARAGKNDDENAGDEYRENEKKDDGKDGENGFQRRGQEG